MGKNLNLVLDANTYQIINASRRTGCDARNLDMLVNTIRDVAPDIIIMAAANVGSISYVSKYSADVVHDNTLMYVNLYRAVIEVDPGIQIINPISNCSYPYTKVLRPTVHPRRWDLLFPVVIKDSMESTQLI